MAKWTLPEGKIYTQADLDAAVAAALDRALAVAEGRVKAFSDTITDFNIAGMDVPKAIDEGLRVSVEIKKSISALNKPDAGAALDRYVKERSDEALAAERDRCVVLCQREIDRGDKNGQSAYAAGARACRDAIRHGSAISAQGGKT